MAWFPRQWIIGTLLTVAGVGGLFLARDAVNDMGYWGGLALFGTCVLGVFVAISDAYDPLPVSRLPTMPKGGALRYAVGGIVGVFGIYGLLRASGADTAGNGFVYYDGLALFGVAVAYDFLLIKDWFDRSRTAAPDSRPEPCAGSSRRAPASAAGR